MKLKKMLRVLDEMRKEGTLPDINSETIELPFGAKLVIIKHPILSEDDKATIQKLIEYIPTPMVRKYPQIKDPDECELLKYAVFHPFCVSVACPLTTKKPDMYEVRISDLSRKEAEEIYDHINQSIIEIKQTK